MKPDMFTAGTSGGYISAMRMVRIFVPALALLICHAVSFSQEAASVTLLPVQYAEAFNNDPGPSGNEQDTIISFQQSIFCDDTILTFEEALSGKDIPEPIRKTLTLGRLPFYGYDGEDHYGYMVYATEYEEEIIRIFTFLFSARFPIEKMIPVNLYRWSDEASMRDNNTSCFNYRTVKGTSVLSRHARGMAIDINPRYNPSIKGGTVEPSNGVYDPANKGTITPDSEVVKIFKAEGWLWGGDWKSLKDYQHFYRPGN
jgi:peptidoglycan L-alanyl-D-glutamate endopeptidase CwlK